MTTGGSLTPLAGEHGSRARGWPRSLAGLLVLVLLALGLYSNALANPLLIDDALVVGEHPDVHAADGWWRLWGHDYWHGFKQDRNLYRPITILSFHATERLGGGAPAVARGANAVLLGLAAWLLFAWLRAWRAPFDVAACSALLFLAHPLHAAVVDYVVGRSDLLVLVGVLGFLLCQRHCEESGSWSRASSLLAGLCASVAIGSKESGAVLLPLVLLQAACSRRASTGRGAARRSVLLVLLPFALYGAARLAVIETDASYGGGYARDPLLNPLAELGLLARLPAVLALVAFYARQVFAPDPSFWHVPDRLPSWGDAEVWLGGSLALALLFAWAWLARRRHVAAVALALALGQFLVIGNLLRPVAFYAANRLAGPFVLAAAALLALLLAPWLSAWTARSPRRWALLGGASLLLLFPMVREVRWVNARWSSQESMVKIDLERHPDELDSLTAYAKAMLAEERFEEALEYSARSRALRPEFLGSTLWMATAHLQLGGREAARPLLEEVIEKGRGDRAARLYFVDALINLGTSEIAGGELAQGKAHLLEAEALRPGDCRLIGNLAALAEIEGDARERVQRLRQLGACRPDEARARLARLRRELLAEATALEGSGDDTRALATLDLVLEIDPGDRAALERRARLHARQPAPADGSTPDD